MVRLTVLTFSTPRTAYLKQFVWPGHERVGSTEFEKGERQEPAVRLHCE
eukprot:COSAG05_NODE_9156_length_643_cov_1.562500_2_plen_48_part_01